MSKETERRFNQEFELRERIDALTQEAISRHNKSREHFIAEYLKATGASIEDTVLVEQNMGDHVRFWCQPKDLS